MDQIAMKLNGEAVVQAKPGSLQAMLKSIENTVHFQTHKLTDLEDCSTPFNLIIHDISDDPNEAEVKLKQKVITEVFKDKLKANCESIGRIHKLGKEGNKRPVIGYLQDFNEKMVILGNSKYLKGLIFTVQNDYSQFNLKKGRFSRKARQKRKMMETKYA